MIVYQTDLSGVTAENLQGFFVGWPNQPSPQTHLRMLQNSAYIVLARDADTEAAGRVVGFINATSDYVLSAYIPLLEVLPSYQKRGIGAELVQRMMAQLQHLYAIDLICDPDLIPFYRKFGLQPYNAMVKRHYDRQSGA